MLGAQDTEVLAEGTSSFEQKLELERLAKGTSANLRKQKKKKKNT